MPNEMLRRPQREQAAYKAAIYQSLERWVAAFQRMMEAVRLTAVSREPSLGDAFEAACDAFFEQEAVLQSQCSECRCSNSYLMA